MRRVLFVDDNRMLSCLSCDILQREGYRAVPAYSGEEALAAFDKEAFDILITDYRMGGMNGLELARAIHARNPQVPVIMVTAYGPIKGEHVHTCLAKDRLFPKLLEHIRTCLAEIETRGGVSVG